MVESEFNTLIQRVMNQNDCKHAFVYKIPDPTYQELMRGAAKRPLDLVGTFDGLPFLIESKLIKGFSAFNIGKLEDHQIVNLTNINKSVKDGYVGLFVAFWEPRTRNEFIYIPFNTVLYMIENGIRSIKKKHLQMFKDEDFFIPIKKGSFSLDYLRERCIDVDDFRRIVG